VNSEQLAAFSSLFFFTLVLWERDGWMVWYDMVWRCRGSKVGRVWCGGRHEMRIEDRRVEERIAGGGGAIAGEERREGRR
jgi:hypothetical protein